MTKYIVGETRTLYSLWTDSDGNPINPTVELTIRDPENAITTPAPTNPSVGRFEHELTFDLAGMWYVSWSGTTSEGTRICEEAYCVIESSVLVSS